MFASDRFIYLELPKTGSTHIRNTLKEIVGGEHTGTHNRATSDLFQKDRIFLGSVRDPWVWYTSLWGYGCDRKGSVYVNTRRSNIFMSVRELEWQENPFSSLLSVFTQQSKHPQEWMDTYRDVNDAGAFREWLRMMHDEKFITDIGGIYAVSSTNQVAGLMTLYYLKLFCSKYGEKNSFENLSCFEKIKEYEQSNCFVNHFIKSESMIADILQILESYDTEIPEKVKLSVQSRPKSNTSSKKNDLGYYYDPESVSLIAERERLIIEKFGYKAPDV